MTGSTRHRPSASARAVCLLALIIVVALGGSACGLESAGMSDGAGAGARMDAGGPSPGADATVDHPIDDGAAPVADAADGADDTSTPPAPDAGPPDPKADAGTDAGCATGLTCGGQCSPTASCNACAAGNLECTTRTPRACTATCATDCPGSPVECYQCGASPGGQCQSNASAFCFDTFYTHCRCTLGDPSTCPIDSHVCVPVLGGAECRTCGEAMTDKRACKNGKTCDAKPGGPGPGGTQVPACAD